MQVLRLCCAAMGLLLILDLTACQGPTPTPAITPAPAVAIILPSPTPAGEPPYVAPVPNGPAPTPQTPAAPTVTPAADATPVASGSVGVPFWVNQGDIGGLNWPQPAQSNLRSLRFLVSDGRTFLHDVVHDTDVQIEPPAAAGEAWRITYTDRDGRYRLVEEVTPAATTDGLIVRARLEALSGSSIDYQVYLVATPSLANAAEGDSVAVNLSEAVAVLGDRQPEEGDPTFVALATDTPWVTASAGYTGLNDGLSDLRDFRLDQAYETAGPGGDATLTVWLVPASEWTIALGLGADADRARAAAVDVLTEAYQVDQ